MKDLEILKNIDEVYNNFLAVNIACQRYVDKHLEEYISVHPNEFEDSFEDYEDEYVIDVKGFRVSGKYLNIIVDFENKDDPDYNFEAWLKVPFEEVKPFFKEYISRLEKKEKV